MVELSGWKVHLNIEDGQRVEIPLERVPAAIAHLAQAYGVAVEIATKAGATIVTCGFVNNGSTTIVTEPPSTLETIVTKDAPVRAPDPRETRAWRMPPPRDQEYP